MSACNSHQILIQVSTIYGWVLYRRLSEKALFPKLCVMLKKLSSEYQTYACGYFFRMP